MTLEGLESGLESGVESGPEAVDSDGEGLSGRRLDRMDRLEHLARLREEGEGSGEDEGGRLSGGQTPPRRASLGPRERQRALEQDAASPTMVDLTTAVLAAYDRAEEAREEEREEEKEREWERERERERGSGGGMLSRLASAGGLAGGGGSGLNLNLDFGSGAHGGGDGDEAGEGQEGHPAADGSTTAGREALAAAAEHEGTDHAGLGLGQDDMATTHSAATRSAFSPRPRGRLPPSGVLTWIVVAANPPGARDMLHADKAAVAAKVGSKGGRSPRPFLGRASSLPNL